jgi:hypothetical protein
VKITNEGQMMSLMQKDVVIITSMGETVQGKVERVFVEPMILVVGVNGQKSILKLSSIDDAIVL